MSTPDGLGEATPEASATTATTGPAVHPDMTDAEARVVLLGKPGCHLCDVAREAVTRVCAAAGEAFAERSTLDDVRWEMDFWELIPVVFVDGRRVMHWRVDEQALAAELGTSG